MISFNNKNTRYYSYLLKLKSIKDNTGVFINKKSEICKNTVVGDGTRINGKIIIKGHGKVTIGKYCAIAQDVRIRSSNHDITTVNLQYRLQRQLGLNLGVSDSIGVDIGHNVWIGDRVTILAGVTIGNGAVIAAGAVVTKNVPAYSVVGGIPAKIIKYRFDSEKIKAIEEREWWDWSMSKMKQNLEFFK